MFLSKYLKTNGVYLKTNGVLLKNINGSVVLLLLLLQVAVWYPFLSQAQDDLNQQSKLKARAENDWKKTQQQANQLHDMRLLDESWLQHRVEDTKNGVPTQWSINGSASLIEWQIVLEKIETQFALGLLAASWQRESNGYWQGHLLFAIKIPKANREYHDWLPTKLYMNRFEQKDWQLLSTMRIGDNTSALVVYKNARHWVSEGSWLPDAGLTVNDVSFDRVTLMAKDGSEQALVVRKKGAQDE
ncbi:hypothetical protein AB8E32_14845 [Marinomonas polaris]|uniref:hypothetical protein n=1 Tax=Marinomonas polaris TaxID=293552 RepID=UPI003514D730